VPQLLNLMGLIKLALVSIVTISHVTLLSMLKD